MKTVMISGASGGIGRCAVRAFANSGFNVFMLYNKSRENAVTLSEELTAKGKSVYACACDITNESDVRRAVALCEYKFGALDVLINNAGISEFAVLENITEQMWDRMMDVNVKGAFLLSRTALPILRERRGKIINVSSMWGLAGASCEVHYSASKAAIIGFTKALAKEEAPSGMTVNCIAPGFIETEMNSMLSSEAVEEIIGKTPLGRAGKPEDISGVMLFLASSSADFITGQTITVDGGYIL